MEIGIKFWANLGQTAAENESRLNAMDKHSIYPNCWTQNLANWIQKIIHILAEINGLVELVDTALRGSEALEGHSGGNTAIKLNKK